MKYAPGQCSNITTKLESMHAIIELVVKRNIISFQVYGDPKMVVDWVNNKIQIKAPRLHQLLKAIRRILNFFSVLNITHVYRDLKTKADTMSKLALLLAPGEMAIEEV